MTNVTKTDLLVSINHNMDKKEILKELERDLEIGKHINNLNSEVRKTVEFHQSLRPLHGKRIEVLEKMSYIDSEVEMEVMLEYPPRKGSEAQRTALREKLRNENESYVNYKNELQSIDEEILDIRFNITMVEQEAKNSRRVVELHTSYVSLIQKY